MADAIQFTVPDDDYIQLTNAGAAGSLLHQGGFSGVSPSAIILVESGTKPTFDPSSPTRFKDNPATAYIDNGESESYNSATTLWAVSAKGDQLLSVTPAV